VTSDKMPSVHETALAESVARLVATGAGGRVPRVTDEGSFDLVERRLTRRELRGRRLRATAAVASVLLAAAGGYWGWTRVLRPGEAVITYRVNSGPSVAQGDLFAPADGAPPTDVTFSDGTRMRMEPRSRGRVVDLDRRGGRVALYDGRASVEVRHRADTRWLFQAGPFEVRVHGTAFTIGWDAAHARFDLRMESGVVSVAGPISGGEMVLGAGESLSIGLGDAERGAAGGKSPAASPGAAQASTPPSVGPPVAPAADSSVGPLAVTAPSRSGSRRREVATGIGRTHAPTRNWRTDLADGQAGLVVADARRRGLGQVLETADSEDLAALADAARYVGSEDLARRAFLSQRRRFAGSMRAAEASFLLGRLEEESSGASPHALAWYDRYLEEAPAGAYVSEAMGRKMTVLERAHRHDEAIAIAADYLRRFPAGSYAHAAKLLVGSTAPAVPSASRRAR